MGQSNLIQNSSLTTEAVRRLLQKFLIIHHLLFQLMQPFLDKVHCEGTDGQRSQGGMVCYLRVNYGVVCDMNKNNGIKIRFLFLFV